VFKFKSLKLETGDVGNNVKEIKFGFLFPLASKSSWSHVIEILKPFEVADSDTTSVNENIREEYNSLLSEDLLSGDGSRSLLKKSRNQGKFLLNKMESSIKLPLAASEMTLQLNLAALFLLTVCSKAAGIKTSHSLKIASSLSKD